MFIPREQLSDPASLDTITGPLSVSTSAPRIQAVRRTQTSASNTQGTGSDAGRSGSDSRSGSARSRGTHRAGPRRATTRQGHGRLVVAGTASLAGISALVTGMALSGSHDNQASEIGTAGTAPSTGVGSTFPTTDPIMSPASLRTPSTGLVPPAGHPWSGTATGRFDGSRPAAQAGGAARPEADQPQTGFTPGSAATGADPGLANPSVPPTAPATDQPPTAGASTGPVGEQPAVAPQVQTTSTPADPAADGTPPADTSTSTAVAPAGGTTTNTGQPATTGTSANGQTQTPGGPDATVSSPPVSPVAVPSSDVIEFHNFPPVWPHSR